jgi:hypothetical protein
MPAFRVSVTMPDESTYNVSRLFGDAESNTKLALSDGQRTPYVTIGLSLAPSTMAGLGVDLCPHASPTCRAICLVGTGQARAMKSVNRARVAKSRLWITQPDIFRAQMVREIDAARASAHRNGKRLAVRLNVFSDVVWERKFPELFMTFPDVQFYDYTKIPGRKTPMNYHLTFSRSENNHDRAVSHLQAGGNVAVVFEDHTFPTTWHGAPVVDGTLHDLRFLDPEGVVVALAEKDTEMHGPKYMGKRNTRIDTRGFVLPTLTSNVHGQAMVG